MNVGISLGTTLLYGELQRRCSLLCGVTVGHNDDHRNGQTLLDEVVHNLASAAHIAPRILVAATTVQQVENGILGLCVLGIVIAVGGINIHTAVQAQRGAVVPNLRKVTALVSLEVVLGELARNDQNAQVAGTVALLHYVARVVHRNAINDEVVGVELRCGHIDGVLPYALRIASHIGSDGHLALTAVVSNLLCGHKTTSDLHASSVRSRETEGDLAILDFGRCGVSRTNEVGQLLCAEAQREHQCRCKK